MKRCRAALTTVAVFFALAALPVSAAEPPLETTGPFAEETKAIPPELVEIERECKVVIYYFVPSDREPVEDYQERITLLMRFANSYFSDAEQTWYPLAERESTNQRGLSFVFDPEKPGQLYVKLIRVKRRARFYNGMSRPKAKFLDQMQEHGKKVWPEAHSYHLRASRIDRHLQNSGHLLPLVFSETYELEEGRKKWPDYRSTVALGYPLVTSQSLVFQSAPTIEEYVEQMQEKGTGGAALEAHEIGHALGLPHTVSNSYYHIMSKSSGTSVQNFLPDHFVSRDLQTKEPRPKVRFSPESRELLKQSPWLQRGEVRGKPTLNPQIIE